MTRKPLNKKNQTRLNAVVESFPQSWNDRIRKVAGAYAQKLLKVEQGIRATDPPQYELSDAQVKKIRQLVAAK